METLPCTAARTALQAELRDGVVQRDRHRVEAAARWLLSDGLAVRQLYELILRSLSSSTTTDFARSPTELARLHEMHEFLRDLVARLRPHRVGPGRGQIVVALPDGSRHLLGLAVLQHVIEECDFRVVSAGNLPLHQLPELVHGCDDPVAVLLSLHEPDSLPAATSAVLAMRALHPQLRVLVTGLLAGTPSVLTRLGPVETFLSLEQLAASLELQPNPLSPRERDVLACVAGGMTNPETGAELGVAAATVKTHLDRVNAKLGTNDRTAAVAVALRRGWID